MYAIRSYYDRHEGGVQRQLDRLFDAGRLESVADLYTIGADELAAVDRMGELSAAKVRKSLRTPREVSLSAFVSYNFV